MPKSRISYYSGNSQDEVLDNGLDTLGEAMIGARPRCKCTGPGKVYKILTVVLEEYDFDESKCKENPQYTI